MFPKFGDSATHFKTLYYFCLNLDKFEKYFKEGFAVLLFTVVLITVHVSVVNCSMRA